MTAKTQAEIQKEYRDRKRQTLIDNNARIIKLEIYKGTQDDIAYLMDKGDYTDEKELITILIRNVRRLPKTGMDLLLEL